MKKLCSTAVFLLGTLLLSSCGSWNGYFSAKSPESITQAAESFLKRPNTIQIIESNESEEYIVFWKGNYQLVANALESESYKLIEKEESANNGETAIIKKANGWNIVYVPKGLFLYSNTIDELNKIPRWKKVKILSDLTGKYETILMYK